MLRIRYCGLTILGLYVFSGSIAAQTAAHKLSPQPAIVARSGSYQLTEEMVQQALRFGEFLAGTNFSPSDTTALRSDLIAIFQKEPAKQMASYEAVAKAIREAPGLRRNPSMLAAAVDRYKLWQWYAEHQQDFREFQSYPFGKMVLKYNPAVANSGGIIVTRTDIECQFYSDALVAKAAGVPSPAQAEKDRFIQSLPSRFASLPKEQQEYLRRAELRLADFRTVYDGTVKTRAAVLADIRKNVHSSADVWREARRVENDSELDHKYWTLYLNEAFGGVANANRVNADILWQGQASRSMSRSGEINTPIGSH